jgi:hypothetical protein
MWSYPIIRLKYHGPNEGEVASTGFLEGNSNLGDGS